MNKRVYKEYQKLAPIYDRRWHSYLEHTYNRAISALEPVADDYILDCSGGTGGFAKKIAEYPVSKINIVDFSEEMLLKAKNNLRTANRNIEFDQSDVHQLPYNDNTFNKVYCISALHYYDDARLAIAEMSRVCKPGGHILILDWTDDNVSFRIFVALMKRLNKPLGTVYSLDQLDNLFLGLDLESHKKEHWTWRLWSLGLIVKAKNHH